MNADFLTQRPLNPSQQTCFVFAGQFVLPDSQNPPAPLPECAVYNSITNFVPGEFLFPKNTVGYRVCSVLRAAMPETTVHKHRELQLWKNEIRPDTEGRARHSVRADGSQGTASPTMNLNLPPPARDAMPPQQFRQRQFRILVAAPANPRHHLGTFGFGKDISHSYE